MSVLRRDFNRARCSGNEVKTVKSVKREAKRLYQRPKRRWESFYVFIQRDGIYDVVWPLVYILGVSKQIRERLWGDGRAIVWMCLVHCAFISAAQTNSRAPVFPANRYLLVVETSHSMQRRAEGLAQTIESILSSAMASQARRGDSLGVWTFNEELMAGRFPLQHWSPDAQKAITERIVSFLKEQKLEKGARFDRVIPAVDRLVKNSGFISVILVCVGDEEIHGTPFDQRINEFFRTWRVKQQESGRPFVVALRAQGGHFVECAMNPAPWPTELPALPKELNIPLPPPPVVSAPKTSSVPPLIISGKKANAAGSRNTASVEPKTQLTNAALVQTSNAAAATAAADQVSNQPALLVEPGNKVTGPGETTNNTGSLTSVSNNPVLSQTGPTAHGTEASAPAPAQTVVSNVTAETNWSSNATVASTPVAAKPSPTNKTDQAAQNFNASKTRTDLTNGATTDFSNQGISSIMLWSVGAGVLVLCVAGIWVWRRRARPVRETSLITESIDRDNS